MKTHVILSALLIIVMTGSVSAQVILEPAVTGDVSYRNTYRFAYRADIPISAFSTITNYVPTTPLVQAGWSYYQASTGSMTSYFFMQRRSWINHGVLEFNIDQTAGGDPFPVPWMTENNWVAYLDGLVVDYGTAGVQLQVDLFDMDDGDEDGAVTETDFNAGQQFIQNLFNSIPPDGTEIDQIDVTEQLREDLFGASSPGSTSGFILTIQNPDQDYAYVTFNHNRPQLKIILNPTPPTPTPQATVTLTPTPQTPTPQATVTPNPTTPNDLSVQLALSQSIFRTGDRFLLTASITNFLQEPFSDQPFVLVMDAYGSYFWYPGWTGQFEFDPMDLEVGTTEVTILNFTWPAASGTASGIRFYGAVLDQDLSNILGTWDWVQFGWNAE